MEEILKDPRFAHTLKDPRFRQLRVKYTKTKIDSRFKRMLEDKEFTDKYTVDKRGRPINTSAKEKFDRLYDYESEEQSGSSSDDEGEPKCEAIGQTSSGETDVIEEKVTNSGDGEESDESVSDEEQTESSDDIPELSVDGPDYARGATLLESSDDDGDEGEDDDLDLDEEALLDHHWNELDYNAPMTEESTHRLALCKMDWDRIKAKDIYVLCNSFLPQGGAVKSVTIYPSEEGLQRMAEEARTGPREFQKFQEARKGGARDGVEQSKARDQAILRKYQIQRLNYYYAVIVCDAVETADKIYQDCNGMEYEKSANQIDLRFIPDDMTFDQEPRETCTGVDDIANFEPTTYRTTALCQDKVDLTWDETSIDRLKKTMKTFTPEDCEKNEGAELIASSESSFVSDSDEEDGVKQSKTKKKKKEGRRKKWREVFRQSLNLDAGSSKRQKQKSNKAGNTDEKGSNRKGVENGQFSSNGEGKKKKARGKNGEEVKLSRAHTDEQTKKGKTKEEDESDSSEERDENSYKQCGQTSSEEEGSIEYTWQLSTADKKLKNKSKEKVTPWEAYEQKKKTKKKEKKKRRKLEKLTQQGVDVNNDLGFDDPFFNEKPESENKKKTKKQKMKEKLKKRQEEEIEDEASKKEKAALSLLINDEGRQVQGFNLLQLMKEEKAREKKKGKKRKQTLSDGNPEDNFELKLDDRFGSLFTDPDLHIDPNAPEFKKTKGMSTMVEEVLKKKRQRTS